MTNSHRELNDDLSRNAKLELRERQREREGEGVYWAVLVTPDLRGR
jgi:hypothetical protein